MLSVTRPGVRALILSAMLAGAALLGSGAPSAQGPASVRGRVDIGIPVATRRPSAAYATRTISRKALAPASELRNVVVYLEDAPPAPTTPVAAAIVQRGETFVPRVVAVPVGSYVEFPNEDPIYHNVFSLSRARTFNLGRFPRGQSRRERFDTPGVIKVFCDIHSHMSATVVVFDHPWYAVPDQHGRFEIPAVPAGQWQLTAWHERLGDTTTEVSVEPGRAAGADFVLPVPRQ